MIPDLRAPPITPTHALHTCTPHLLHASVRLPHWIRVTSTVNTRVVGKRHGTSRGLHMIDSKLVVKSLRMSGRYGVISSAVVSMMACGSPRPAPVAPTPPPRPQVRLAVIPAESDA